MQFNLIITTFFLAFTAAAHEIHKPRCLEYAEALSISTRWLQLFNTGAVTSISNLTSILAPNITSYDEAFSGPRSNGPGTTGIQEFYDSVTAPGNTTTTDVKQFPLFLMHSCDQIAHRWQYTGRTTGYNSTVPASTFVEFKGIDILHVDLKTRLIFNATSSGDWINLARELGEQVTL